VRGDGAAHQWPEQAAATLQKLCGQAKVLANRQIEEQVGDLERTRQPVGC